MSFLYLQVDRNLVDTDPPFIEFEKYRQSQKKESELTMHELNDETDTEPYIPTKESTKESYPTPFLVSALQQVCQFVPGIKYAERIRLLAHEKSGISLLSFPLVSSPPSFSVEEKCDEDDSSSSSSTLCPPPSPFPSSEKSTTNHDRLIYISSFVPGIQLIDTVRSFAYDKTRLYPLSFSLVHEAESKENTPITKNNTNNKGFVQNQYDKVLRIKVSIISKIDQVKNNIQSKWNRLQAFKKKYGNRKGALRLFNLIFCKVSFKLTIKLGCLSNYIDYKMMSVERFIYGYVTQPRQLPLYVLRDFLLNTIAYILDTITWIGKNTPIVHYFLELPDPRYKIGAKREDMLKFDYMIGSKNNPTLSFSFSGNSSNPMYEIGAAQCIREHISNHVLDEAIFMGSGTGALIALAMAKDLHLCRLYDQFKRMSCQIGVHRLFGSVAIMSTLMRNFLMEYVPDDISYINDHLVVPLTTFPCMKPVRIYNYNSRRYLLHAVLASLYSPILYEAPVQIDDETFISGNYTDPIPIQDKYTITISSVPNQCNISPSYSRTWAETLGMTYNSEYFALEYQSGYSDAMIYLIDLYESEELSPFFWHATPTMLGLKERLSRKRKSLKVLSS